MKNDSIQSLISHLESELTGTPRDDQGRYGVIIASQDSVIEIE